jgi:hypothetical protein
MSQQPDFEVIVAGNGGSSIEEWKRAQKAPDSELPPLNEAQKEVARKFGINEEQYQRSYLSLRYGEERTRSRAKALGVVVEEILESLGRRYRLLAVVAEMANCRWVVRIQTSGRAVGIAISRELGDDIVDSNTVQDRQQLKRLLLSGLRDGEPRAER